MNARLCVYPGCILNAVANEFGYQDGDILWCNKHFGLYPHQCEQYGCDRTVQYNDEPMCFVHSPDSGSSVSGYSAYKKQLGME